MFLKSLGKSSLAMLLLLIVLGASGCKQRVAGELLGRWVGVPDTAAARAERESQKYGEVTSEGEEVVPESVASKIATDWESFDLSVALDFVDYERVEMTLSGESVAAGLEPVSGKWHIVSTSPVGCTIEVETAGAAGEGEKSAAAVHRHFQLNLDEREGECVGFTLMEVGADRQLGMLYFHRPEGM